MSVYETLEKNYIVYEKSKIHVIIDSGDKIWFNVKDALLALGYKDYRDAIKKHLDKKYTKQKSHINYYGVNGQPRALYVLETGLYKLITKSRLPKAIRFTDWIFDELLPKIRKFGKYKLKKQYDNEMYNLSKKINFLEKQNEIFKRDLKKEKYPKGGVIYVIDYSDDDDEIYRIGMTGNMLMRKKLYDTHNLHNHKVVLIKQTNCPIKLETCLRAMLYDSRYKNKKDFYVCSLHKIKKALNVCQKSINCITNQSGGSKHNKQIDNKMICQQIISLKKRKNLINKKLDKLNKKLLD